MEHKSKVTIELTGAPLLARPSEERAMLNVMLGMVAGHFIADYVFQTDAIATGKNRHLDPAKFGVNWWYWMTAHSITHGLAVYFVTGSVGFGLAETVAHWFIDFGKCEKRYGLHVDQGLHILCKVMWAISA